MCAKKYKKPLKTG